MFLNSNSRLNYDTIITQNEIINKKALHYTLNTVKQPNRDVSIGLSEPNIHTFGSAIQDKVDDNSVCC